jgi:hypothetical protein
MADGPVDLERTQGMGVMCRVGLYREDPSYRRTRWTGKSTIEVGGFELMSGPTMVPCNWSTTWRPFARSQ